MLVPIGWGSRTNAIALRLRAAGASVRAVAAGLCVALLVAACGSVTPFGGELKQASLTQGGRRSVCVASSLGNSFSVVSLGLTALTSEQVDVPVDTWQVDDYVRRRVHELIGASYDVRHVQSSGNAFASLDQPGALFRNLGSERVDILRKLVYGERCDYLLLIARGSGSYGTTGQTVRGLGIVRSGDGIVIDNVYVYALANVYFYENHSFKQLVSDKLPAQKGGLFSAIAGPHKSVDRSSWPTPAGTADSPQMKAAVLGLLDAGLSAAIPDIVNVK